MADEDPKASDPEIVTRMFKGDGYWAIVATRPACKDPFQWPAGSGLSAEHKDYVLTVHGLPASPLRATLCDVETLAWKPLELEQDGDSVRLRLNTNWALVALSTADGPLVVDFARPPATTPGNRVTLKLATVNGHPLHGNPLPVSVNAPGMKMESAPVSVPGDVALMVPPDTLPGLYAVTVHGQHVLGVKRFLKVE